MFKTAELGQAVSKAEYEAQVPELRARLVQSQYRLKRARFSIIMLVAGNDSVGRHEAINRLNQWTDPRLFQTLGFGHRTAYEKERPRLWRYWRALPPNGRAAIFYGSWVRRPLMDRIDKLIDDDELQRAIHEINAFEKMLVDDGTVLLKFWLHLSKDALARRLKAAEKDPETAWLLKERDWEYLEHHERVTKICTRFVAKTSTAHAPWIIVESADQRFRDLTVARMFLQAMDSGIERDAAPPAPASRAVVAEAPAAGADSGEARGILDTIDLSATLSKRHYKEQIEHYQGRLHLLGQQAFRAGLTSVLVFEGWDAAGKGSAIRRLVAPLDPRDYRVISIAAPTDEEKARHYLWRFWRQLPGRGRIRIFDRSWYGRVLVERVEGFATEPQWRRAYAEINEFEEQLTRRGILLLKFWLHIDPHEQLRRFQQRQRTPFKRHKLGPEDFRNRDKWGLYEAAVNEMVQRTSTEHAPWCLVEGNDKRHARVKVIRTFVQHLQKRLT